MGRLFIIEITESEADLKQPLKNQVFPSLQALWERVQDLFDQLMLEQVMSVSSYNSFWGLFSM